MNFSENQKLEKKIGFVTNSVKKGRVSSEEVKSKFSELFKSKEAPKRSKFTIVDGIPYKSVNGKLVPLTRINK